MAHAIRSIYLIRPSSSPERAHSSSKTNCAFTHHFQQSFFQNLSVENLKRLSRQINWGYKCVLSTQKSMTKREICQSIVIKNEKQINNSRKQLMKHGKISDKIHQRLRSTGSQPARIYDLAKVQKKINLSDLFFQYLVAVTKT